MFTNSWLATDGKTKAWNHSCSFSEMLKGPRGPLSYKLHQKWGAHPASSLQRCRHSLHPCRQTRSSLLLRAQSLHHWQNTRETASQSRYLPHVLCHKHPQTRWEENSNDGLKLSRNCGVSLIPPTVSLCIHLSRRAKVTMYSWSINFQGGRNPY